MLIQKRLEKLSSAAQGWLKYAVAALILSVALYPKFPFMQIPGVPVAVRLEDFVVAVVLLIWLAAVLPHSRRFFQDKRVQAIFLFWAVGLLSVFAGTFLTDTVVPHIGLLHWARRVQYLSMFFVGLYSLRSKQDLHFYVKLLLIVILMAFIYGVGQVYFNLPIITTQNPEYARGIALRWSEGAHLVSTFAGHYDLAGFLILVFPTLYLLLTAPVATLEKLAPGVKTPIARASLFALSLMALWLLMMSASRMALVSYFVGLVLALTIMKRKKFIPVILFISLIFAGMSTNLVERYMSIIDVTIKRVVEERIGQLPAVVHAQELPVAFEEEVEAQAEPVVEDRSTSIRLNVEWPRAIRAFQKNPLVGTGYSSITLATDNGYLRMLGETGLLGLASFFVVLGNILLVLLARFPKATSFLPEDHFLIGVLAAIPGILLNMIFIDLLEASKFAILFWLVLGFAVKASWLKRKNYNENN